MSRSIIRCGSLALTIAISLVATTSARAHFPWLAVGEDGKVLYFFGENPAERNYKLPASLAKVEIRKQAGENSSEAPSPLAMSKVENDSFVGLQSDETADAQSTLAAHATYGIYQGSRLDYYTLYQGALPKSAEAPEWKESDPPLMAWAIDTEEGVDVFVFWKGKPLSGVEAKLFCDEGHEEGAATTDDSGKVSFTDGQVEDGLNGVLVGQTLPKDEGEYNGKPYKSSSHYVTLTFEKP